MKKSGEKGEGCKGKGGEGNGGRRWEGANGKSDWPIRSVTSDMQRRRKTLTYLVTYLPVLHHHEKSRFWDFQDGDCPPSLILETEIFNSVMGVNIQ